MQTDLTRDQGRESLEKFDLKWINLVSLDETCRLSAYALISRERNDNLSGSSFG